VFKDLPRAFVSVNRDFEVLVHLHAVIHRRGSHVDGCEEEAMGPFVPALHFHFLLPFPGAGGAGKRGLSDSAPRYMPTWPCALYCSYTLRTTLTWSGCLVRH
jgi:hypothetical protein